VKFRCTSYNANRIFTADDFEAAAARIADHLARRRGGRRACAWTLREDSTSSDRSHRHYNSTAGIPTKAPGECRVVGENWFTVRAVGGAA
jgi:hypothetical protein